MMKITTTDKIKVAMRNKGISQLDLARALGVHRNTIQNRFKEDPGNWSLGELETIAKITGVKITELLT